MRILKYVFGYMSVFCFLLMLGFVGGIDCGSCPFVWGARMIALTLAAGIGSMWVATQIER